MNSPMIQPEKEGSSKIWLVLIQVVDVITFFPGVMIMVALDNILSLHIYESGNIIARFALGYVYPIVSLVLMFRSWQIYRQGKYRQAILLSLSPFLFVAITIFLWLIVYLFVITISSYR